MLQIVISENLRNRIHVSKLQSREITIFNLKENTDIYSDLLNNCQQSLYFCIRSAM